MDRSVVGQYADFLFLQQELSNKGFEILITPIDETYCYLVDFLSECMASSIYVGEVVHGGASVGALGPG